MNESTNQSINQSKIVYCQANTELEYPGNRDINEMWKSENKLKSKL